LDDPLLAFPTRDSYLASYLRKKRCAAKKKNTPKIKGIERSSPMFLTASAKLALR